MNPKVEEYIANSPLWKEEIKFLRSILLEKDLVEELKWGQPCYTLNNKNILLIGVFKDYCSLSFFNGALISIKNNMLEKPGENSRSVRMMKFRSIKEIKGAISEINSCVSEAIKISSNGIKVEKFSASQLQIPIELKDMMESNLLFAEAFNKLSLGRKRGYCMFFSAAKQTQTRIERINKYENRILSGKGLNDCVCGLSKKMHQCDGSHKLAKQTQE